MITTVSKKLVFAGIEQAPDDTRIERYKCDVIVDLAGDDPDCTFKIPQQVRITQIEMIETYDHDELKSKIVAVKWLAGRDLRQEMPGVKISDDSAVVATLEKLLDMPVSHGVADLDGTALFDINDSEEDQD